MEISNLTLMDLNASNVSNISNIQSVIFDHTPYNWIALSVFIGIVCFNALVIILLFRRRKSSRMAFFVLNLAFSDMGVAIFYLLPQLLYNYFVILEWGEFSCKTYGYLHMTSFHISTNSIVVLTIDRLFVIVFPLSMMSKTRKYRYGLAMLSWLSGAIMSVPYSPHYDVVGISCKNNTPYIKVELWLSSTFLIFIPVVIIVICYSIMIHRVRNRNRRSLILRKGGSINIIATRYQNRVSKTKIRTIQLLFIVVIAYILSWSPIFCGSLLHLYNIITSHGWISLWHALAPLNSLANPLIFLIFNWKKFLNNNSRRRKSNVLLLRDKKNMFRSCSSSYDRTSAISSTYTY